jgi:hypothetical protein
MQYALLLSRLGTKRLEMGIGTMTRKERAVIFVNGTYLT